MVYDSPLQPKDSPPSSSSLHHRHHLEATSTASISADSTQANPDIPTDDTTNSPSAPPQEEHWRIESFPGVFANLRPIYDSPTISTPPAKPLTMSPNSNTTDASNVDTAHRSPYGDKHTYTTDTLMASHALNLLTHGVITSSMAEKLAKPHRFSSENSRKYAEEYLALHPEYTGGNTHEMPSLRVAERRLRERDEEGERLVEGVRALSFWGGEGEGGDKRKVAAARLVGRLVVDRGTPSTSATSSSSISSGVSKDPSPDQDLERPSIDGAAARPALILTNGPPSGTFSYPPPTPTFDQTTFSKFTTHSATRPGRGIPLSRRLLPRTPARSPNTYHLPIPSSTRGSQDTASDRALTESESKGYVEIEEKDLDPYEPITTPDGDEETDVESGGFAALPEVMARRKIRPVGRKWRGKGKDKAVAE